MNKLFLFWLMALFIIIGCASKKDRHFISQEPNDVEKKFNIEKDTLKKFKVETLPEKEIEVKKEIVKKTNEDPKKKKQIVSEKKKETLKKDKKDPVAKRSLPSDYPKEFLKYDKISKKVWSLFRPRVFLDEEFTFRVSYLGLNAGYVKMTTMPMVKVQGQRAYRFRAQMQSSRYYELIYSLDDSLESIMNAQTFRPIKYTLIQRESKQDVDDLQLFDLEKLKTYIWYKKVKNGHEKKIETEKYIPQYFQDSYSSLYFVRGLPLKIGDEYEFPVVTRGKVWMLNLKVEKIEEIKTLGKWKKAIRVNAVTRFPGVLKKKGDIIFWYSNDDRHKLLKFQAKIKIGAINGELTDYRPGTAIE